MNTTNNREKRSKAASSTMTKNEYQTDIHELIQKPPPTSKNWPTEKIIGI